VGGPWWSAEIFIWGRVPRPIKGGEPEERSCDFAEWSGINLLMSYKSRENRAGRYLCGGREDLPKEKVVICQADPRHRGTGVCPIASVLNPKKYEPGNVLG